MSAARRWFEEIEIGEESVSPGRTVTESDIVLFAGLSGDYNILHTDAEFMKASIFGERIAHGLLGLAIQAGLFSRAGIPYATLGFGTLRWKFKGPIKIGVPQNCSYVSRQGEFAQIMASAAARSRRTPLAA